jgi:transcriptional regulator with XRE-family HTH domain
MSRRPRARSAGEAERHATDLAAKLGKALRDGRRRAGLKQREAAARAGLSQPTWSMLEIARDASFTLATWDRAAHAVGSRLRAYVDDVSVASLPRDAVHLKGQELILRTALPGGWRGLPEARIDGNPSRSRYADVLLERHRQGSPREVAVMELIDWFEDVGAPTRDWQRRLEAVERQQIARMRGDEPLPRVSGCWVIRATRRNRDLVVAHASYFRARFPGSGRAWLAALNGAAVPMPAEPALLWISVSGERLYPARLA